MNDIREKLYNTKFSNPELFERYSKKGVVSIFVYSRNVLKNGTLSTYSDEPSVRSLKWKGETYVPVSFFAKFLDCSVEESTDANSLPTVERGGVKYVSALGCAEALGIEAREFDGGKLIVFADKKILDEIEQNDELLVSASYATVGKYDASRFTKADFDAVKEKWRTVLLGSEELNDLADPDFCGKINSISEATKKTWESLHTEKDRVILWGENPPEVSGDLTTQYRNIWALAKGYGTYGTCYYKNEALKETILDCLEWMYENMYGDAEIEGRGWRSMKTFNWWDWFWGGPEPLTDTLIVMEEHLTREHFQKYLKAFLYVLTIHRLGYIRGCAMSRLTVCTKAALLLEDRALLEETCADYDLTLNITRMEDGVHVDYVEWTHGFPLNMMYGFNNFARSGFVGTLLGGTPMEYISPKQYELYNIAKYMFETACYKGQGFIGFNGRGTGTTETMLGVTLMHNVLPLIGFFGEEEDLRIKKLVKRCASTPRIVSMVKNACSVYNFAKLMEILRDESIPAENDYEIGYAWFTADRFAQHRNDYAFFVAMPSERHPSYESICGANRRGWYTCDGAVYYYNNTDRNAYDGVNFILNPDICQRIPGTTVDVRARQPWFFKEGWKPGKAFSGAMDVLGKYGMAAFEYESYHYEGHEADGTDDSDYGGGFTYWENDLKAKKSYYFFDKEMVCLGAGISSTMSSDVITTIEHRRLVKNGEILGEEDVYIDGELMPKDNYERVTDGARWLHLEGFAGYVLPFGANVRASRYTWIPDYSAKDCYFIKDPDETLYQNGKPFFEINVNHGKNPKDESYAYIVLPNASKENTELYAQRTEVEIISNTKSIQAVRKPSLGLTFITFYEAGECAGVEASKSCIVALYENGDSLSVSVSDPTQKEAEVTLTLDKKYAPIKLPLKVGVEEVDGKTVITAKTEGLVGEALRLLFKK